MAIFDPLSFIISHLFFSTVNFLHRRVLCICQPWEQQTLIHLWSPCGIQRVCSVLTHLNYIGFRLKFTSNCIQYYSTTCIDSCWKEHFNVNLDCLHIHPPDFDIYCSFGLFLFRLPLPSFFFYFFQYGAIQITNTTGDNGDPCGTPTLHDPLPLIFPSSTSKCYGLKARSRHLLPMHVVPLSVPASLFPTLASL